MTTEKQVIITLLKNLDDAGIKAYFVDNLEEIWSALDIESDVFVETLSRQTRAVFEARTIHNQ
jgi:hypothetical protein